MFSVGKIRRLSLYETVDVLRVIIEAAASKKHNKRYAWDDNRAVFQWLQVELQVASFFLYFSVSVWTVESNENLNKKMSHLYTFDEFKEQKTFTEITANRAYS